jgi:hypothetical protein
MKKSFALFTGIILLLLLVAFNAQAQYATKNVVELGGSISYSSSTAVTSGNVADKSTSIFQFLPYVNYFITDGFSLALAPGINIVKLAGASSSITMYALFLSPGYTFSTGGKIFPYIEGMVGYTALKSDSNPLGGTGNLDQGGLSFGGKAGIKIGVGNSGLAAIGASYILINLSPKGADSRTGINNLAFSLGYSIYLK